MILHVEKECGRHGSVMHRHEHEAVTGWIIELCVLTIQVVALSLLAEVCLANNKCQR